MATLTLMFPDDNGIELTIYFEPDAQFFNSIAIHKICLSAETPDFSEWLSESAMELIERKIKQAIDSAYLCAIAVDYENAA